MREINVHLIETKVGTRAVQMAAERIPFGPGFPAEIVKLTSKIEVYGSDFDEPGPDYCLFRVFNESGQTVGERRVNGY